MTQSMYEQVFLQAKSLFGFLSCSFDLPVLEFVHVLYNVLWASQTAETSLVVALVCTCQRVCGALLGTHIS